VGGAAFIYLINFFTEVFTYYSNYFWAPIIILAPALGGLIVAFIAYRFAPESGGHGVSEVMESIAREDGRIRARVPIVKMIVSAITIGSGGSAGDEGPIVQIVGGTGSVVGRIFKMDDYSVKLLVVCGAAAGISAVFKAPLGGVFFGLEIVYGGLETILLVPILLSSVVATAVSQEILGTETLFHFGTFVIVNPYEYLLFFALGVAFGLLSIFWIKIFHYISGLFQRLKVSKYLRPGIGGLMVGFVIFFFPQIMGEGYQGINALPVIALSLALLLTLGLLKIIGTSITLGSGGSGGAFAPTLFIGAMFGGAYGAALQWLLYGKMFGPLTPFLTYVAGLIGPISQYLSPAFTFEPLAYALVGMGALVASATRAPLTGIVLITEATRDYTMIPPLIIACITAYLVSRLIMKGSLYTEPLLKKGIDMAEERRANIIYRVRVKDVMSKPRVITSDTQISQAVEMMSKDYHHGFPVLDNGTLVGIIDSGTVLREVAEKHGRKKVGEVVNKNVVTVFPEEYLYQALDKMIENETDELIVVDRNDLKSIIGVLTGTDILQVREIKLIMERGTGNLKKKLQKITKINREYRAEDGVPLTGA
jgi:CIC family chloride channel protein